MTDNVPLIIIAATLLFFAGCRSAPPAKPDLERKQSDIQNQGGLQALSDLAEIKEELKQLRNAVEEIQFETENTKRRQHDLFQDLDRRMASVERNESLLNPQPAVTTNAEGAIGDSGTSNQQHGEQGAGSANQVLVVSSGGSTSSTSNSSTDSNAIASQNTTIANTQSSSASNGSTVVSLQEQQAYDQAFELLKQSRYEDAITQFQQMADTWPDSQLADDSYYWMSEARYVDREFELALGGFRTVVSRFPDSPRVPEALLKVGYIQYDIGSYEEAAETFRDILTRFPGHQVTVAAETRLRRIEQTIQ